MEECCWSIWLEFCSAKMFDEFFVQSFFMKNGTNYAFWSILYKSAGSRELETADTIYVNFKRELYEMGRTITFFFN